MPLLYLLGISFSKHMRGARQHEHITSNTPNFVTMGLELCDRVITPTPQHHSCFKQAAAGLKYRYGEEACPVVQGPVMMQYSISCYKRPAASDRRPAEMLPVRLGLCSSAGEPRFHNYSLYT